MALLVAAAFASIESGCIPANADPPPSRLETWMVEHLLEDAAKKLGAEGASRSLKTQRAPWCPLEGRFDGLLTLKSTPTPTSRSSIAPARGRLRGGLRITVSDSPRFGIRSVSRSGCSGCEPELLNAGLSRTG